MRIENEIQRKETPIHIIRYRRKNLNTLDFLEEWETVHNPNFNKMVKIFFKLKYLKTTECCLKN
jgi:hypothetical protein